MDNDNGQEETNYTQNKTTSAETSKKEILQVDDFIHSSSFIWGGIPWSESLTKLENRATGRAQVR